MISRGTSRYSAGRGFRNRTLSYRTSRYSAGRGFRNKTSSYSAGKVLKNTIYKDTDIMDWEGDTQSKIIFSNWFEKNYKIITEKASNKDYDRVWKYFSKDKKELKKQLYYDRLYVSNALHLNMEQSVEKFEHTRAFITAEAHYWYNMVNAIRDREPMRYAQISNILNTRDLYNAPVQYDKEAQGFKLYGEKTVYLLYCKYDDLSPKTSISSESDFELEVIGPNE